MTAYRRITQENYESWFLLYVDNELSEEQQQQVKQFVASNPHLATELETLLATVNQPREKVYFKNKGCLYKNEDDVLADEDLILFLDGEASHALSEKITKSNSQQLQQRLSLLRKAYTTADATICYYNKQKLLSRGKAIAMRTWLFRIAAAVIIAAVGIWLFSNTNYIHTDDTNQVTLKASSIGDTLIAPAVAGLGSENNNKIIVEERVMIADKNSSVTPPQQVQKIAVTNTPKPTIVREEKASVATVMPERKQQQLPIEGIKSTIEIDTEPVNAIALEDPVQKEAIIVTASTIAPSKKRNRFFKNVSEKIKETAIEVLSDDNENIIVAGIAINVRK